MLAHYLQHLALFFLFFTPFLENNKNDHDSTFNLFTTLFSNKKSTDTNAHLLFQKKSSFSLERLKSFEKLGFPN